MSRYHHTIETRLDADGGLLWLILDRPRGNVLTIEMVSELGAALDAHRDARDLKLVALRGAGYNFSFGASVEEHRRQQAPAMLAGFHRFIRRLAAYPVPTAALVEGNCLGGGFEVALVCHFLFASEGARFACPEIKLGVFAPVLAAVGGQRLGRLLAERLLLTGETLSAEDAERLGLLTAFFDTDDLAQELLDWYEEYLAPLSAHSLRQATRAARAGSGWLGDLDRALAATEEIYLEGLLPSHDGNEGIEAFLDKRQTAWKNA